MLHETSGKMKNVFLEYIQKKLKN